MESIINNPMALFAREAPEAAKAFDCLVNAVRQSTGIDEKTKHLIYISIKAVLGDTTAVHYHVPMAKKLGASRDEIKDAILITLTVCGLQAVANCLPLALEIFDNPI
ncbi:MAG TPA: carboxymuconolactone decarboxylase family protein [Chitinophagaceae bacterium]|nr:carboxymuconolactone decarboxylase family protein [Chitinophagaceae bacterium]